MQNSYKPTRFFGEKDGILPFAHQHNTLQIKEILLGGTVELRAIVQRRCDDAPHNAGAME
jgi:hypothetical protein